MKKRIKACLIFLAGIFATLVIQAGYDSYNDRLAENEYKVLLVKDLYEDLNALTRVIAFDSLTHYQAKNFLQYIEGKCHHSVDGMELGQVIATSTFSSNDAGYKQLLINPQLILS